jgi:hypothetical protein
VRGEQRQAFGIGAVRAAAFEAGAVLPDPRALERVVPLPPGAPRQPFGDERRLVLAVEGRVVAHDLLQPDDVGVERRDDIDGPREVVVALGVGALVDVVGGDAEGAVGASLRGGRIGHRPDGRCHHDDERHEERPHRPV